MSDVRARTVELLRDIDGVKVTHIFDDATLFQGFTVQFPALSADETERILELMLDQADILDARHVSI